MAKLILQRRQRLDGECGEGQYDVRSNCSERCNLWLSISLLERQVTKPKYVDRRDLGTRKMIIAWMAWSAGLPDKLIGLMMSFCGAWRDR